jgi:hypothetical protein
MMESALSWIGDLARWIGQFFPRVCNVRATHHAVKFKHGRVEQAGPGMRCYWPLTTDFVEYPVVRQAVILREQTVVTTDDKTVVIGGMIVYEVSDLQKLCSTCYYPDQTIKDLTLTSVHDVVCKLSWPALKEKSQKGTLDTALKNEVRYALEEYGVKVVKVMLTDLAPARVLRIVQTEPTGVKE